MQGKPVRADAPKVTADLMDACATAALAEQLRTAQALLAATFRLSGTRDTGEAADVVADVACELTGAQGAHVYLPDRLGGQVWANANTVRTTAQPGTLVFDLAREAPDIGPLLDRGADVFVADGLAGDSPRRALRLRHGMASLLYVPLLDVGLLVLWWEQPQGTAPVLSSDMRGFLRQGGEALRRRLETTTLRDLTVTDPLTRLVNRRGLLHHLEQLPAHGGLLLMDLDHFKRINDTLGHRYGDEVLQTFADLLRSSAPEGCCVARWGGEEFAVVLPTNGRYAGTQLFTQLRAEWRQQGMSFSAGLAVQRSGARAEETFEAADRALYAAKQAGRDRLAHAPDVAWDDEAPAPAAVPHPRHPAAPETALTLSQLEDALDRGLVRPHYQPVVEVRTGQVVAVEALARLAHPGTGALLEPAQFLPLAERTGRVRRVDSLVAAAAIADTARWRRAGHDLSVGVNVSVDHLDDPELPQRLLQCCADSGLVPDALVVEVTETLRSVTGRGHGAAITRLRDAGVNVTLDDFGTGFSALSYLLRFDVAGIKIDKSFVAALGTARGQTLVTSIIDIAASLGLHVVAEGVETPEQLGWLEEHGCTFAQGYLFSRPVPGAEVPRVLQRLSAAAAHRPAV